MFLFRFKFVKTKDDILPKELLRADEAVSIIRNRVDQKIWGSLSCTYLSKQWRYLANCLRSGNLDLKQYDGEVFQSLIHLACVSLDSGGIEALPEVLEFVALLINSGAFSASLEMFLHKAKLAVFNSRKNSVFWRAFQGFIRAVFGSRMLQHLSDNDCKPDMVSILDEIFQASEQVE